MSINKSKGGKTKVLDDAPVGTTVFDGTTTITDTQTKSWGETATFWKNQQLRLDSIW